MSLIKKLQECSTLGQADPILTRLGAGPAVKKLVETALILSNSSDPQQRSHAFSFMESAIKELEDDKEERKEDTKQDEKRAVERHEDRVREEHENDKEEHKLHEEELDNNNNGSREEGSEQSSDNTEPYPGTGKDSANGEKPMQDMDGTVNQWNETGMIVPGLAPEVAEQMGNGMPQLPDMNTNQMMRQMQYTLENYHKRVVAPMRRLVKQQREAIKQLSMEIKETRISSGSMKLDIDSMRNNASARFRETEVPIENSPMFNGQPMSALQPLTTIHKDKLDSARSEIIEMDKIIRSEKNNIYN